MATGTKAKTREGNNSTNPREVSVRKTIINPEAGKGWEMFRGSGVDQLTHSEGVRIDLPDYSLL